MSSMYIRKMTAACDRSLLHIKLETFDSVVKLDASFFDLMGFDEITSVVSSDPSELRDTLWSNLERDRGFRAFGDAVVSVVVVIILSWRLAFVYVAVIPIVATLNFFGGIVLGQLTGKESEARARCSGGAAESLSAIRTVIAFGAAKRESHKFSSMLEGAQPSSLQLGKRKALNDFTGGFGLYVAFMLCLAIGGYMMLNGSIPLSSFLMAQSFLRILNSSFQGVLYTVADAAKAGNNLRRIYGVREKARHHSYSLLSEATAKLIAVKGEVEFVGIKFAYPLRPNIDVIRSLSLLLEQGTVTALVGHSGAGKSTIGALLCRLYEPQRGHIFLDGIDISTFDRDWYSEQVTVVSQEPVLLAGTIREAIEYGAPDRLHPVPEYAIMEAAKKANAHHFICALPQGYDTQVGTSGGNLSGGQRQRIAIARAILRSSPVLLLDEATSALDSESERLVQQALERQMKNRTCLVIAHRLSTIKHADKIVVIGQGGSPLEQGSYEELMRKNGAFSKLMRSQTAVYVQD